jgi:hypothetical protein
MIPITTSATRMSRIIRHRPASPAFASRMAVGPRLHALSRRCPVPVFVGARSHSHLPPPPPRARCAASLGASSCVGPLDLMDTFSIPITGARGFQRGAVACACTAAPNAFTACQASCHSLATSRIGEPRQRHPTQEAKPGSERDCRPGRRASPASRCHSAGRLRSGPRPRDECADPRRRGRGRGDACPRGLRKTYFQCGLL